MNKFKNIIWVISTKYKLKQLNNKSVKKLTIY